MAQHLGVPVDEFRNQYVRCVNGWEVIASPEFRRRCFLDDDNMCRVYEHRPIACRTYPHWPQIWESEKSLQQEMAQCPGLKRAVEQLASK
jgi:Fe-S-cluster containining protein